MQLTPENTNLAFWEKWHVRNPVLWFLGSPSLLDMPIASVVGSRELSEVGERQAELLVKLLVRNGCCVVSGLARGADRVAHETALACAGKTIAVMGTPIDECYPAEHRRLKDEIAEQGLVLSQFPPGQKTQRGNFPRRNELMAALCPVTFVVEASLESGTQWQVRAAMALGHRVGFLPSMLADPHPWVTAALENGCGFPIRKTGDAIALIEQFREAGVATAPPLEAALPGMEREPENLARDFDELLAAAVSRSPKRAARKKIHGSSLLGQQGINLVASIVGEMGFLWTPTTASSDAGIDGFIEIRDRETGEATNQILQVQCKATGREWDRETVESFEYRCEERDLDYWMQGNAPVILLACRPQTREAYWVSVKDYFQSLDRKKSRIVRFDKQKDQFGSASAERLTQVAMPREAGIYLAPPPVRERLCSNLLPIARYPQRIFIASTTFRKPEEVWAHFKQLDIRAGGGWFIKDKQLISFNDLSDEPWHRICDAQAVQSLHSDEWGLSTDPVTRNDFVRLLGLALREQMGARGVWYHKPKNGLGYYYFAPSRDLSPKLIKWKRLKESERAVFRAYFGKKDPTRIAYYRHLAFEPRFCRYGGQWYLEITPTYHFTSDGKEMSFYHEEYLSGIKRYERHGAVRSNVEFWGAYITSQDLFSKARLLTFAPLLEFEAEFGIPENDWLSRADEQERARLAEYDELDLELFDEA